MRTYEHKPPQASDGQAFENLCVWLHRKYFGVTLTLCTDRESQFKFGDTFEGYEFKELKNSPNRLHIEVAENNDGESWFPSGIYAANRARFLVCGSHTDVWAFWRKHLVAFHENETPDELWYGRDKETGELRLASTLFQGATIKSFVLDKARATAFFRYRFTKSGDDWHLVRGPCLSDVPTECVRAGVELTREEWFSLSLVLRRRYWQETEYGSKPASSQLVELIRDCLGK